MVWFDFCSRFWDLSDAMQLNLRTLWPLMVIGITAQWSKAAFAEGDNYAVEDATNIGAIVLELKDIKIQADALSRLDEMLTKWNGTNYAIFSPTIDGLMSMIGW